MEKMVSIGGDEAVNQVLGMWEHPVTEEGGEDGEEGAEGGFRVLKEGGDVGV